MRKGRKYVIACTEEIFNAISVIREGVRAIVIAAALLCVRLCWKFQPDASSAYGQAGVSPSAPQGA